MTKKELQELWNLEKNEYQNKEIGSGVQLFVKKVLNCNEIFKLDEGKLSTNQDNRKNEYLEEITKKQNRADIVIFINKDFVIPVEVEKTNNIQKGVEQLFQYQKDWQKKYGILTDGNEWRFYKSSEYKKFFIEDILNNSSDFQKYWDFYTKPENYYNDLFNTEHDTDFYSDKLNLNFAENRVIFFDEITSLIKNFKVKMKTLGAFEKIKSEKIEVETSYAYLIQFILYKVLVDNEFKKFKNEYNKLLIKVKKAIQDTDFYSVIINEIKNISEYISLNIYKPFKYEQNSINKKLIENLKKDLNIDDIAPWLDIILFINRYNFSGLKNEIFGFIYENFLKDLYADKNKGQYFTDPGVVNFMLEEIGYTKSELKNRVVKKEISIIDPSCGAGTFLYSAVDRIIDAFDNGTEQQAKNILKLVNTNIFGIDIEEFPLYLAEMNIIMRLLPLIVNDKFENPIEDKIKIFKTKDSISEFLDTGISAQKEELNLFSHLEKTSLGYPSFMRDEDGLMEMLNSMQEKAGMRARFDFVIGNPPYIGYNECCKQEIEFTKKIKDKNDNSISMSNVYGVNLNTVAGRHKKNTPKPNLYSFFIALGLALLKNNGKLSFIIPQNVLTTRDLDVVRYYLSNFMTIEKIITFEGNLFVERGLQQNKPISTSSLVFVVKKKSPQTNNIVEIKNFSPYSEKKGINFINYLKNTNIKTIKILQTELQKNIRNWNFIKKDEIYSKLLKKYNIGSISVEDYRLKVLDDYDDVCFDIGYDFDEKKINPQIDFYIYPKFEKKYFTIKKFKGFLSKNDNIKLLRANQGYKLLEKKYKILWSYNNPDKFYFSDLNLISARNNICFIGSNNKNEHLFLFAILNCKLNKFLLESFLKNTNEKAILIGLSSIKDYIRIPKINEKNNFLKDEIIRQTEKLLALEELQLKDFVEFTTIKQKFAEIRIFGNNLELIDNEGNSEIQKINSKPELVKKVILEQNLGTEINLNDLKYTEAIDYEEQNNIKSYIDDLIFALYFDIDIADLSEIKNICEKNEFYNIF